MENTKNFVWQDDYKSLCQRRLFFDASSLKHFLRTNKRTDKNVISNFLQIDDVWFVLNAWNPYGGNCGHLHLYLVENSYKKQLFNERFLITSEQLGYRVLAEDVQIQDAVLDKSQDGLVVVVKHDDKFDVLYKAPYTVFDPFRKQREYLMDQNVIGVPVYEELQPFVCWKIWCLKNISAFELTEKYHLNLF